ncbi:hypothetical protein GCM10009000_117810 [Halobacterium noricense]
MLRQPLQEAFAKPGLSVVASTGARPTGHSLSLTAQGVSENEAAKWFKHVEEGEVALECRYCDGQLEFLTYFSSLNSCRPF